MDSAEQFREDFIDRFAAFWHSQGPAKVDGRIVGYLLVCGRDSVGTAELAAGAGVSRGSVSMATRRLEDLGFLERVAVPGNREGHVRAGEDLWGNFLRNERPYLASQRVLAEGALAALGDLDPRSRRRLENMRDYMSWLDGVHDTLSAAWEQRKRARDAADGTDAGPEPEGPAAP